MSKSKFKAVLFDLDDTLLKSYEVFGRMYEETARDLGFEITDEDKKEHWGKPADQVICGILRNADTLENLKKALLKNFNAIIPPHGGSNELVDKLFNKGIKLGVVSSGISVVAKQTIINAGFDINKFEYFSFQDNSEFHKPDPRVFDPILNSLKEKFSIEEYEVAFVGDSFFDFFATKGTKITFFAVTSGLTSKEDFLKEGLSEDQIFGSMVELQSELLM